MAVVCTIVQSRPLLQRLRYFPLVIGTRRGITGSTQTQNVADSCRTWDIYASVCLERKPQITRDMTPFEKKFAAFLAEYELENSYKSDHEMRHLDDARLAEKIKSGEVDSGSIQTAQDFEDKSNAELLTFVPASRKTDADHKNDTKSLSRALDSHLVLVVAQKLGKDYRWVCPQIKVENNQTLRQAADKILQQTCPNITAKVMGNAPFGFYKYKYPAGVKNEAGQDVTGAKVFFYKANYVDGKMEPPLSKTFIKDFLWLKREELKTTLQEKYYKQLSQFLVPEGEYHLTPA